MNFIRVTPFMHVPDIGAAVAFFRDILGFAVPFHLHTYAYVQRETAAFRLLENARAEDGAPPGNRRYGYCIDVEDVDGLMAELKPKLDTLPRGDVLGPVDQPYGQREFMLVAPGRQSHRVWSVDRGIGEARPVTPGPSRQATHIRALR